MFKVGDRAECGITGKVVEIQFGPFMSVRDEEAYLVKRVEGAGKGCSGVVLARDLSKPPRFAEGMAVRLRYDADVMHIVAGPFLNGEDSLWVLKDDQGHHYSSMEEYMLPVVE
jgi:hypothetical protein